MSRRSLLVVAGLSLRNLHPRVWDPSSEYYLKDLRAVMVPYSDFHLLPWRKGPVLKDGLHAAFGIPQSVKIFLDNGSFFFRDQPSGMSYADYEDFVARARPDWWPIPQDFIPTPRMRRSAQEDCLTRTMRVNSLYKHDGYVPVMHVSKVLDQYILRFNRSKYLAAKRRIALGGIVPNLLRASKAIPYERILSSLRDVREGFADKELHVFGMGGTATLHLAAILGIDSADSSGWRNRAARGLIQLPGTGDRMVTDLGSWRGRELSAADKKLLSRCECPACCKDGLRGLRRSGLTGFCNRATHNLWVLLQEGKWLDARLRAENYAQYYRRRLDNSIYLPLIEQLLRSRADDDLSRR